MYELMVIGKGVASADELAKLVEKHLADLSATGSKLEKLGKKTLAYPISRQLEGEYLLWVFEAQGDAIFQLSERLRMDQENILRFLLTKFNPKASKPVRQKEEKEKPKAKVTVTTKVVSKVQEKDTGKQSAAAPEKTEKKKTVSKTKEKKAPKKGKK